MADVAAAVEHMHGGGLQQQGGAPCAVLHNDLRAQNVVLTFNGNGQLMGKVGAGWAWVRLLASGGCASQQVV